VERSLGVLREQALDWQCEPAQGRTVEAILKQEHAQTFDLANGPLIRVRVIEQAPEHHFLIVSNHHA
jgi:hypothetical protein